MGGNNDFMMMHFEYGWEKEDLGVGWAVYWETSFAI